MTKGGGDCLVCVVGSVDSYLPVLLAEDDADGGEGAFDGPEGGGAAEVVVDDGPAAGGGPAVVVHPETGSGGVEGATAKVFDVCAHGFAMHEAADVGVGFDVEGADVDAGVVLESGVGQAGVVPGVDGVVVVAPGVVQDFAFFSVGETVAHGGKGIGAEVAAFGHHTALEFAEFSVVAVLEGYGPVVLVTHVVASGGLFVWREGRAGLVVAGGVFLLEDLRESEMKEGVVGVDGALVVAPVPVAAFHLVVAAPDGEAGVLGESADLVAGFGFGVEEEVFVVEGVLGAGVGEILPDDEPVLVAEFVEAFAFVEAAAPDADEVEVGFEGEVDEPFVSFIVDAGDEHVGGNPVGAFEEEGAIVDLEDAVVAGVRVFSLEKFDMTKTDLLGGGGERIFVV